MVVVFAVIMRLPVLAQFGRKEGVYYRRLYLSTSNFRKKSNLSQSKLAKEVGVSLATIINIEKGANTTLSTALLISEYFRVPIHLLWLKKPLPQEHDENED